MLGPVKVLVVDVADSGSAGEVLGSLAGLTADGPVRCVDAFECSVDDDGELAVAGRNGRSPLSLALFAEEVEAVAPIPEAQGMWHLGEVVPVGGRAVVALLEHRWAVGLRDSLLAAGAALRYETWLDAEDRDRLESLIEHVQR